MCMWCKQMVPTEYMHLQWLVSAVSILSDSQFCISKDSANHHISCTKEGANDDICQLYTHLLNFHHSSHSVIA